MKNPPTSWKTLIVAVCATLLFGIYYINFQSNDLTGEKIEGLLYNGKTYDVVDGRVFSSGQRQFMQNDVLALANFYEAEKIDPLFVSGSFDVDKYSHVLNTLVAKHDTLKLGLGATENIIPVNFLESLKDVAQSRKDFYEKPSHESANKLIEGYEKAQKAYVSDAKEINSSVEKRYPNGKNVDFSNIGSTTDAQIVLGDLGLIKKNGEALSDEIESRRGLLTGKKYKYALRSTKTVLLDTLGSNELLSENELFLGNNEKVASGPYRIVSSCFGGQNKADLFYIIERTSGNMKVLLPKLATDNYYQTFSKNLETDKKFIAEGYLWHSVGEGNVYRCNEQEYQSRLFEVAEFTRKYKEKGLISSSPTNGMDAKTVAEIKGAAEAENNLFEAKMAGDKERTELLNAYMKVYKKIRAVSGKNDNQYKLQNELIKRYIELRNNEDGLTTILASNLFFDNLIDRLNNGRVTDKKYLLDYLVSTRTTYSITFLNFSPSTWRGRELPKYVKSTNLVPNIYSTYTKLKKVLSDVELLKINEITEPEIVAPN